VRVRGKLDRGLSPLCAKGGPRGDHGCGMWGCGYGGPGRRVWRPGRRVWRRDLMGRAAALLRLGCG